MGVVQSVPTQQLSPFYLLSTRDEASLDPLTAQVFDLGYLTKVLTTVAGASTGPIGVTPPCVMSVDVLVTGKLSGQTIGI